MACDPQTLITDGKCFSRNCLTADQQDICELELLRRWAGYTGTVQELITAGHCFNEANIETDGQNICELQLLCEIASAGPAALEASVVTTDETVVDGVAQANGTVTFTVSGGVAPYTVTIDGGYGSQSGDGPDFTFTGLSGATDYYAHVEDSLGNFYPADWPSSYLIFHLYREAFSWNYSVGGGRGTTSFPAGDLSIGPVTSMAKWTALGTGYDSATLDSVDFSLDTATLKSNYGVTNSISPASCHYQVTTSSAVTLTVESVVRVSATIQRPTTSGNTTLPTLGVVGPAATAITPAAVNFSDGTTLAACTGPGTLHLLYTSVHPVPDQTGSTGCTVTLSSIQYSFQSTVTYNYSVPRE